MITLTRFSGQRFALNPDLIERVEATPDTVITLVDGSRHVVGEDIEEVVDRVQRFRATVIALSQQMEVQLTPAPTPADAPPLRLISKSGGDA